MPIKDFDLFLFDALAFQKMMAPVLSSIKLGNNKLLMDVARKMMDDADPNLWNILASYHIFYPFESDYSDDAYLTMIVHHFLKPLPLPKYNGYTRQYLEKFLPSVGWSQENVVRLFFGEALCTLLLPDKYVNMAQWAAAWCNSPIHWLDLDSIGHFHSQLQKLRQVFYTHLQQDSIEQRKGLLEQGYKDILATLTYTLESQKPLAIGLISY